MNSRHAGSFVLLACGVGLVFAGLISAFGGSVPGFIASTAAIAALLYAGAVWFGDAPRADRSVVLFTRALTVAAGPLAGRPVMDLFPDAMRVDIECSCQVALAGGPGHFTCGSPTGPVRFSVTPVRDEAGMVVCGLLLSGSAIDAGDVTGTRVAEAFRVS
jgi:hypothetical protein